MRSSLGSGLAFLLSLVIAGQAWAGTQRFYYDPLGRLMGETQTVGDIRLDQNDAADNIKYLKVLPYQGPSAVNTLCSFCELVADTSITSSDGAYKATLQDDGNLVVYQTSNNTAVWCTATTGHQPGYLVEGGGNLVLFGADYSVLWQTNTASSPNTSLVMQTNGTLVLLSGSSTLWTSGSGCSTGP